MPMVPFQEGGFRAFHSKRKMFASIRVSEQNVLAYADASARVCQSEQNMLSIWGLPLVNI